MFRFRISRFMETFLLSMWKIQKKEKKSNASICFSVSSDRLQYKERSRSGSENALLTPMSSWLAHRGKWKLRDFPHLSFRQARIDWQSFAIIGNHLQSFAIIGNWQSLAIGNHLQSLAILPVYFDLRLSPDFFHFCPPIFFFCSILRDFAIR